MIKSEYVTGRLRQLRGIFPPLFSRWLIEIEYQPPGILTKIWNELAARASEFIKSAH